MNKAARRICPALVSLLAITVTACGSGGGDTSSAPVAGGTLTYAYESEPDCLDPQVSPLDVTAMVDRNIFDSLVDMTPDGAFHPWLAERWTIAPDGKTYTFYLKQGVTFQDGTPFDASAVKATLDHAVDPKTKSAYAASLVSAYSGATVVDAKTVQVTLSRPSAPFLQALSTAYLGIQSPKSLRDNAANLCLKPVGSGPFGFVSWTKNSQLVLAKNTAYAWGPASVQHTGATLLDGLTFKVVAEPSVRFGALTSGQVDAAGGIPPGNVKALQTSDQLRYLRADAPGSVYGLHLNTTRGPLADERVRIALQRSLNLDPLVKSLYAGQYARAWSLLGPTTVDYDKATEGSWPYDQAMSNRLLDEAGWTARDSDGFRTKDGARLTVRWPYTPQFTREERDILGQGIQAEAKKVGINLDFVSEDRGAYVKDITGLTADVNGISFERAEPDIARYHFASDQLSGKGGGNSFHYANAQLDGWLNGAAATTDPGTRKQDYANAQKFIIDHALFIPVYVPAYLAGTTGKVHGLSFDANAYPRFYEAWVDKKS